MIVLTVCGNTFAQQLSHVVQRGETFDLIARRYNITQKQLLDENPGIDQCFVGLTLRIPKGSVLNSRVVANTPQDIVQVEEASRYLYHKATTTYTKVIKNNPSSLSYFGRGMSYYNREKYKSAINDFEMAMSSPDCTKEMKEKCKQLISSAKSLREQQHERRSEIWGGVASVVVGAAAITASAALTNNNSDSPAFMPPSKMNGFQRDTSLDYLLDPRFAMMQAQQQEIEEYETFKKLSGLNISIDEYRMLKYQSNSQGVAEGNVDINIYEENSNVNTNFSNSRDNSQKSRHVCSACKGKGSIERNDGSIAHYGTSPTKKKCPTCGWEYWSTTFHRHEQCRFCHGTGYQEY